MLGLRASQVEAMDVAARDEFHSRLCIFLRQELPEETAWLDDRTLAKHVVHCDAKACELGIETESGIAQFVCMTFSDVPQFYDVPEVREYLLDAQGNPESRLETVAKIMAAIGCT